MSVPFKSSPTEFNQLLLFPSHIFDLLAEDHECYLYTELFQQLDTSAVESCYQVKGQNAYHRLIVSILIYAYSRGVFSSRQKRTGYELPEDLKHKQGRLANIKAAKKALEQREAQINPGQAIEESKQISFADTESLIMTKKGSRFDYAHNAQISVDADLQIIVAQHISQNSNDQQEVEPALEALQETTDRLPEQLSADNGYFSGSGFRGFSVRGKEKVAGEFSLVCATHNFKKIAKAIFTGLIRPAFGNLATNEAI